VGGVGNGLNASHLYSIVLGLIQNWLMIVFGSEDTAKPSKKRLALISAGPFL